jgi:outer membrane protein assembly factor BamB
MPAVIGKGLNKEHYLEKRIYRMVTFSVLTLLLAFSAIFLACISGALTRLKGLLPGHAPLHLVAGGLILLLICLSACSNAGQATTGQTTPTSGSLVLTITPQQNTLSPTPALSSTDWPTYHRNNQRTGSLSSTPDPHSLSRLWSVQLDGAVYAEPLVIGTHVIIATEGDSLYSLDSASGKLQWRTHVGSPVPLSTLPCGNIDPLGITGTPVYDPATGLVFAVAEIRGPGHILVGVDLQTGQLKVHRSADTAGMDPRAHQQRGALTLAHGMIYIPYGGLDGDCSDYIGRVVASRTDGRGPLLVYRVPTPREGGIWTPPGASVDDAGNLYVAVGNGAITRGTWDHSDSILKLSPTLQLLDAFAPANWAAENAADLDLGSQGPVLLPHQLLFTAGKSGKGYILHSETLGGIGGQVSVQNVCRSFGGVATVDMTLYVPCTSGVLQITVDTNGQMHQGWQAAGNIAGSPVVGGNTLYSIANSTLYALNRANGQVVASLHVGQATRFATPTISGTTVFVGTYAGVVAVSLV